MAQLAGDGPDFARWLRQTTTREDFRAPPEDELDSVRRFAFPRSFAPGARLFRQGQSPETIYIVERGEVELVYETQFDRLIIQFLGDGSSIGELAVMLERPYAYTAVARAETRTLSLSVDAFARLSASSPDICFRWLRLVARRLERAHRRVVELAGKSASERLVHFLLHEAEERQSPAMELTQDDLRAILGLSRQTVIRALAELENQGLIERGRRRVRIRDLDRLRARVPR